MTLFSIYKAAERQTPSLLFLHLDYTLSKRKVFFSFKLIIRLDQVTMNTPLAMQQQGLAAWGIPWYTEGFFSSFTFFLLTHYVFIHHPGFNH